MLKSGHDAKKLSSMHSPMVVRSLSFLSFVLVCLSAAKAQKCGKGNPIDDCWRCSDKQWQEDRMRLADCVQGYGRGARGGKNGGLYSVTDSSDDDVSNPKPGTLRHAVTRDEALWITFNQSMLINLKAELAVKSNKTIDGRGADVEITGIGCIAVRNAANVIIHGISLRDCKPPGELPAEEGGDGISIIGSKDVWVDHCTFTSCNDGLLDVTHNSSAVTLSNNRLSSHEKVMLLGHDDGDETEKILTVTVVYNHFGEELKERMPRCRHGIFHVVNNFYGPWKLYAVGGSANPTIFSEGNVYNAPNATNIKEVTRRQVEGDEGKNWNWFSDGDIFNNGAFFVSSGSNNLSFYKEQVSSMEAKPASMVSALTEDAGVIDFQASIAGQ